jgi:RND family efflux transporter MFP subunit
MKGYRKTAAFLCIGLAVVSGLAAYSKNLGQVPPAGAHHPPEAPRLVRVQTVKENRTTAEQTYTGVVRARYESDLAFRVSGKVIARLVDLGDRVSPRQVLFRLDPRDYELAVKVAEAELNTAEAELKQATAEEERTRRSIGSSSAAEYDKIRAARDMAGGRQLRASRTLQLARNRLSDCTLIADVPGVVTFMPVEVGQVVAEGQIVTRVVRSGEKEAVVSIPENRVSDIKEAQPRVTFWSLPETSFPAVLRELSPVADPVTRTFQARFTLPTGVAKVELGMTATIHLAPANARPNYMLPLSCLIRREDDPAVWVVDRSSGRLILTSVQIVKYGQDFVILGAGVKPGDWVVTAGVQKLDSGIIVRPWEKSQ